MNMNLQGKTALVSASTAGIGHAIAVQLLEEGANVIINGRSESGVAQAAATLQERFGAGRVFPLVADMSVAGSEAIAAAQYPAVDILVNNMGTYPLSDFFVTSDEEWQRMFEVNVWSGVRLARTYMKGMLERGHGRVIFISSEVALTRWLPWRITVPVRRRSCRFRAVWRNSLRAAASPSIQYFQGRPKLKA